ncbi:MAG: hypothetical protein A2W21_10240 [Betaproteobacteria bacterium RBG_16_66_20]|nr:MAG: hypothetical protein A2W21_10240 [Betaproteobacteria bacterium RBG_16_66_20]
MAIISSRPSVALIKTRWRKKGARTLADRAGVIGANVWKISLEIFKHMEKEGFRFGSDRLVTDVLAEFIAFLVQLADRAVYGKLSEADRATLIGEVAGHLAVTMENNQLDLLGPGEYRKPFIALLNARFGEYAGFECPGGEPGYPCVRFFATKVSDAMASSDNKWVVEQIMDIEAPEMVRVIRKLVDQAANTASP